MLELVRAYNLLFSVVARITLAHLVEEQVEFRFVDAVVAITRVVLRNNTLAVVVLANNTLTAFVIFDLV